MKRITLFLIFVLFGLHQTTSAQVPQTLGYQGVLTDATNTPLADGNYDLTFALYNVSTGGIALWTETQTVQILTGVFSVALGSSTVLNLAFDTAYWLGIAVGTETELDPRVALTASPHSLNSRSAVNEPADGDSFAIRAMDGETAHLMSPNGDVEHAGIGFFDGGIVIGPDTTAFVLPDTTTANAVATKRTGSLSNYGMRAEGLQVGVFGLSTSGIGVIGQSASNVGVQGVSTSSVGVVGSSTSGQGVQGNTVSGTGVFGKSTSGQGVHGFSDLNTGVFGQSSAGKGVHGQSISAAGVQGFSESSIGVSGNSPVGPGVQGESTSGTGVFATSENGIGLRAKGDPAGDFIGQVRISDIPLDQNNNLVLVWGTDDVVKHKVLSDTGGGTAFGGTLSNLPLVIKGPEDNEVFRVNTDGTSTQAGLGTFNGGISVQGESTSGAGVQGTSVSSDGVTGQSTSGIGVRGVSTSNVGVKGVSTSGEGVIGESTSHIGVRGESIDLIGVFASSVNGTGLQASGNPLAGHFFGQVRLEDVPLDQDNNLVLVWGDNVIKYKVLAEAESFDGTLLNVPLVIKDGADNEVFRVNTDGTSTHSGLETFAGGIVVQDASGTSVMTVGGADKAVEINPSGTSATKGAVASIGLGINAELPISATCTGSGCTGAQFTTGDGVGVLGVALNSAGLAGKFIGDVSIVGDLDVSGLLSKGGGSFVIDHPLDPENRYLYHSFVESPDMMNLYNGNVVLDEAGEAQVQLPNYFEALNIDYRYQLTAVGGPGPNLYVAQKISGNQFSIAGGAPGLEVSWQVTGIRNDTWARENRIQVEVDK